MTQIDSPTIRAEHITKSFGDRVIWSDLSFEMQPGQMTAILGQSGSGKTTLLNCIAGLEPLSAGKLTVVGTDVSSLSGRTRQRYFADVVGILFQNYALIDTWTVTRNLDVVLRGRKGDTQELKRAAVSRFGLSDELLAKKVYTLSGGEQQRVALARLLLKAPPVIIADEPSSALDDQNAELLVSFLLERCADGATVVVSSHDPRIISRCHNRLALASTGLEDLVMGAVLEDTQRQ